MVMTSYEETIELTSDELDLNIRLQRGVPVIQEFVAARSGEFELYCSALCSAPALLKLKIVVT